MNKEIILTPEQLFFMGRLMQAKYIDYAYVAAMKDVNQNFALFESETEASLVSAGVLMEDFGGNVEIEPGVQRLLKPIFFGETETSVDVCTVGETNTMTVFKYHFHDGAITRVTDQNGKLVITSTDGMKIREQIQSLIGKDYDAENQVVETIDKESIKRVLSFKQLCVGVTSVVKTYIEANGILYQEKDNAIESVTWDQFLSDAFTVVKGV